MRLTEPRVGPYVRALAAALDALAPNADHPPLPAMTTHLRALDPALSGSLLAPAEVDDRSGMPAWAWMERARAEAEVARERPHERDDAELARAERLDPALGQRLRWRRDLHRLLRDADLLPGSRVQARARRLQRATEVLLTYDRIGADGTWGRVGLVVSAPAGARDLGCVQVGEGGRIDVDPGLLHLLTRHADTPLLALRAQVAAVTEGAVRRLARSAVGPFWFPGIALPDGVPSHLGQGLLLHLSLGVVGDDVHHSGAPDPLHRDPGLAPPPGHGAVHTRRFACLKPLAEPLARWVADRGGDAEIVVFG